MKNKILVYPVSGWESDANWIYNSKCVKDINKADVVVFPGGADINPKLYDFNVSPYTHYNDNDDKRDLKAWDKLKPNQLAVGICRGSQFLCIMNGGKLIQHVEGHAIGTTHAIRTLDVPHIELQALSLHHQMMYPFNLSKEDYTILYSSHCAIIIDTSTPDLNGKLLNSQFLNTCGEPEVVVFHKENKPTCLAIQSHPEMMRIDSGFVKEMNNLIVELLKEK